MLIITCKSVAAGPPAVKLPVAALTATTSTTVYQAAPAISPTPKPASRSSSPLAKSTSHTNAALSKMPVASSSPGISVQSGGDTGGDSGGSDSSGKGKSGSQGDAGSLGGSNTSGSSGDEGNTGDTRNTEAGGISESTTGANYGDESSISDNGSGSQDGGGQKSTGSSGSSKSASGGESSKTNGLPSIAPFVVTVGGHTISGSVHGSTAVVVAGNTVKPGSSPSSAGGALVSIHPGVSSIYVNGESYPLPTAQASHVSAIPIATIGSHILTASPGASAVYYAGTTLAQDGAHATIDNTDIYVGATGLVIGGSSAIALPTIDSPQASLTPIAVIGSQTISAMLGASEVYYSDITLTPNGVHATIDNTDIYVGASGLIIGDGSTVAFLTMDSHQLYATPIATIGSQTISAIPGGSEAYYAGTTLTQNGAHVTIDNTDVYVDSSGLVLGGSSTIDITRLSPASITASSPQVTELQTFTLGGQLLRVDSTAVYVGKSTLAVGGPAVTISGTPISLGSSDIVIASKTYTIPSGALPSGTLPGATQTSDGLGDIILGAFGPHTSTASASGTSIAKSNTSSAIAFQGAAAKPDQWESMAMMGALIVGGFSLFVNGI